ncbi:MAG: sensor histidine kinase [Anaerolineales bacterium]|jgi:NarL family two-component system sensor histidine kinase YdfH|uniref:sensor histidine kinase n=1 Tax=Candidatus Villigracilis affinis TaxID=3140682 RepID=UPI001B510DA9|nr:sensor histidine kinase [Anaerolineales bacterium]MBK9602698.1 sensor histidine kinase [Anaerolineales bacterium]MBL0345866.1 sensor histidine kinase [Anaerolineales bacterium]MBP8047232.1 sensor histidine kinase [Anaerolineales bacterium]
MEQNSSKAAFISYPFYIFISLLIGAIAVIAIRDLWNSSSLIYTAIFSLLFLLHIALFWSNTRQDENSRWWFFYYPAQVVLIVAMVNQPFASDINLTLLGSSILCLIGESLGLWGNTRRALYLGIFLFIFMVVMLYFAVGRDRLPLALSSMLVNGGFIVLLMVMFNQQLAERQKAEELAESLESANAKLAASAAKIESLTLQNERQRMARELHDTLAQGVAGLVLQLEAVKAHLASNRNERASAIVEQSLTRARSTLAESRAAIDDLRAASTDVSDSVREKLERFTQATGIPCELEISVNENQLALEITNHALNILNESLTNIARHAQATQVKVVFAIQDKNLQLEVRDNGKGFDVNKNTSGHYGLVGMHERARLTGGMLSIKSNQSGTSVQFIVGRS